MCLTISDTNLLGRICEIKPSSSYIVSRNIHLIFYLSESSAKYWLLNLFYRLPFDCLVLGNSLARRIGEAYLFAPCRADLFSKLPKAPCLLPLYLRLPLCLSFQENDGVTGRKIRQERAPFNTKSTRASTGYPSSKYVVYATACVYRELYTKITDRKKKIV